MKTSKESALWWVIFKALGALAGLANNAAFSYYHIIWIWGIIAPATPFQSHDDSHDESHGKIAVLTALNLGKYNKCNITN